MLIKSLEDPEAFRRRRARAWARNCDYWLSKPLRHVVDVGGIIINQTLAALGRRDSRSQTIVDMGCGSAWAATRLRARSFEGKYIGLDSNVQFVNDAKRALAGDDLSTFRVVDFEREFKGNLRADVVLNAFTFFELTELLLPMKNAARMLRPGGRLVVATIDKTFLIMAVSDSWEMFHANLRRYQRLKGTKYAFQAIDLGSGASDALEYPSVLYSVEDFIESARVSGLSLLSYQEVPYTARPIPKIYVLMEFEKEA